MIRARELIVFVDHPLVTVPAGCGAYKPSRAPAPALGTQATPHIRENDRRHQKQENYRQGGVQ